GRKVRWVGPLLLLLGGIFLFFCADLDLYRFTDPRQWGDREVELHKTIALILTLIGGVGLFKNPKPDQTPGLRVLPKTRMGREDRGSRIEDRSKTGSKPIAIMALIGGGLLFTHVHTVAPYANVAAGVYIAHVVLGLTALCIGAARLLQDGLPKYRRPLAA